MSTPNNAPLPANQPEEYNPNAFMDQQREAIAGQLINQLSNVQAHAQKTASLMVQGEGKTGKTWLLQHVARLLRQLSGSQIAVTYIAGSRFANRAVGMTTEEFHRLLLAELWCDLAEYLPNLSWPAATPRTAPLRQHADAVKYYLRDIPPRTQIHTLTTALIESHMIILPVLIVDGLDEIPYEHLQDFELDFIKFLLACPRVRLLSSRRVKTLPHGWRDLTLKRLAKNASDYMLPPFAASQDQIRRLLAGATLNFEDLQEQMVSAYPWRSPGANYWLTRGALGAQGQITNEVIWQCLEEIAWRPGSTFEQADLQTAYQLYQRFPLLAQGISLQVLSASSNRVVNDDATRFVAKMLEYGLVTVDAGQTVQMLPSYTDLFDELRQREAS